MVQITALESLETLSLMETLHDVRTLTTVGRRMPALS